MGAISKVVFPEYAKQSQEQTIEVNNNENKKEEE